MLPVHAGDVHVRLVFETLTLVQMALLLHACVHVHVHTGDMSYNKDTCRHMHLVSYARTRWSITTIRLDTHG